MAGASLLTLIDDIAALLDDVAMMSKLAAKKTTGVLGDDLALNAQQVSGVRADRELPVVWAVAKGSFKNKLVLVPMALLISAITPVLITILLMIGGAYLCYEGFEKIAHMLFHDKAEKEKHREEIRKAISDPATDMLDYERQKIKGAIRTDFILSAEIIVISLGAVQAASFGIQVTVVSFLAIAITIGVYGIVAGIVKLDDAGLHLQQTADDSAMGKIKAGIGMGLIVFAPYLMKTLSIVGTAAMFTVGGGILVHDIPLLHHAQQLSSEFFSLGDTFKTIFTMSFDALAGVIIGAIILLVVNSGGLLLKKLKS